MTSLRDQLILHESLKLKPYRCTAGKLTWGVGYNITARGLKPLNKILGLNITDPSQLAKLPREAALAVLDWDIADTTEKLMLRLPWMESLDAVRQKVLIDMAFNLGVPGLMKFKNTLRAVREARYSDAAAGMTASLWFKQTKSRALRLRRMMLTGEDYTS